MKLKIERESPPADYITATSHVFIAGVSGSGKSRLVQKLVSGVGARVVILDTNGRYDGFLFKAIDPVPNYYRQQIARCPLCSPVRFDLLKLNSEPLLLADAVGTILSQLEKANGMYLVVVDDVGAVAGIEQLALKLRDLTPRRERYRFILVTEKFAGLVSSESGRAVLADCSMAILLRQSPFNIQAVQDYFRLSPEQAGFLRAALVGEGLLLAADGFSAPICFNFMLHISTLATEMV